MRFDIITIFPDIFSSYFSEGIISRAQKRKLVKINIHNLRDYTFDKHQTVDDRPYGGGSGMVLMTEPIMRAVRDIKRKTRTNQSASRRKKIVLLSAKGKLFNQKLAEKFSKLDQLIIISGRYEGIDERVAKFIADEEISIGPYVLTGGELPAMAIIDATSRLIPGVIKKESLSEESFSGKKSGKDATFKEYPHYTHPEIIMIDGKARKVPKVLLSGNHRKIKEWREKHSCLMDLTG